jgi:hypothetical protein
MNIATTKPRPLIFICGIFACLEWAAGESDREEGNLAKKRRGSP